MLRSSVLIVLSLLIVLLMGTASAEAGRYYMTYGQAKQSSKEYAKEVCLRDSECIAWGVGKCRRQNLGSFKCLVGFFYPGAEPGEEVECDQILRWGVGRGGYIRLKHTSRPHCFVT